MKQLTKSYFGAFILGILTLGSVQAFAAANNITITSIVQRADGVFFGISTNGRDEIISAAAAKVRLEQACPRVHFSSGVLG